MENHYITIENREKLTLTQVADVDAFDEETLWANLKEGGIEITGERLNIEKLDLQEGMLVVTGQIGAIAYTDRKLSDKGTFLKKLTARKGK